nr:exocyst complex component EXO84a [Tanacetum cinerariifolium]
EDREPSKMEVWLSQYKDNLNILLAERRVDEALASLDEGEREIKHLVTCLLDLKKASAEEMRKSVYANYPSFIRVSREISDLEGQL